MPIEKNKQILIAVVIPAFKVKTHVLQVVKSIGKEVQKIIVVDDSCPQESGKHIISHSRDPRVEVIFHASNMGVGGAVKTGYRRAFELGAEIVVKVDGDGQMDTSKILELTNPISKGLADYTKGNRFFNIDAVTKMPKIRILGNLGLSFLSKLSSGYWQVFDPNNGFTAISRKVLAVVPLDKIDNGYFFESDMLFRLNVANARVVDISMTAIYEDESSNLKISRVLIEFPIKHFRNLLKRIGYTYYLREFNLASIELPLGLILTSFGLSLGAYTWLSGFVTSTPTQPGTLILIAMSVLAGLQLILAFFAYDTNNSSK